MIQRNVEFKQLIFIENRLLSKIERFFIERRLAEGTQGHYKSSVKAYEELNNMSLDELLEEAETEERNGVIWADRKLKKRLIKYRNYVYGTKLEKTADTYFGDIKTIYRHFERELHALPSFRTKQVNLSYEKDFEDLLTIDELKDAYYEANNAMKEIILFGSSTGLSKIDMLKMVIDKFVNSCLEYIESIGIKVNYNTKLIDKLFLIKETAKEHPIIPCFKGRRQKTNIKYCTFCSPEATEHIVQELIGRYSRIIYEYEQMEEKIKNETNEVRKRKLIKKLEKMPKELTEDDKLFDISESHLNYTQRKINSKLGLGKVGKYSKFRCHQLRSFHASTLLNCEENGFTESEVDALQGRTKDKTHRAYLIESKEKLFKKFHAHVDELMLFKSIHSIDEEAFDKLQKENNFYKKEIVKNERKLEEQEEKINKILAIQSELEALVGLENE